MPLTEQQILDALRRIPYPGFRKDVVALGAVRELAIDAERVRLTLVTVGGQPGVLDEIESRIRDAILALGELRAIEIRRATPDGAPSGLRMAAPPSRSVAAGGSWDRTLIPQVRHTVAVASGKGGVGKSTVAVNLAVALAAAGKRVGLLDADVYGPSVPLMMGLQGARPRMGDSGTSLIPFERWGVRFMSIGFLVEAGTAVIWRGPMVMKALEQLLRDVEWGELDVLLLDMPPGTGDAQLTVSQRIQLAGAVIVTTPQDVALADAIKGVAMFRKVDVPILGLVENMSFFLCPHCSERTEIFGSGGGRDEAKRMGVPLLAEIPLEPAIRQSGDAGEPIAVADPQSGPGSAFHELADRVLRALDES